MAESTGLEPVRPFLNGGLAIRCITTLPTLLNIGGNGEIRTHGPFLVVCFQDRCNKPDSATFPWR